MSSSLGWQPACLSSGSRRRSRATPRSCSRFSAVVSSTSSLAPSFSRSSPSGSLRAPSSASSVSPTSPSSSSLRSSRRRTCGRRMLAGAPSRCKKSPRHGNLWFSNTGGRLARKVVMGSKAWRALEIGNFGAV